MSRKQRELDREMRNCKRKETQLKIAQDSLESTQHLFNNAKEVVDLPNPNVLLNQVRSVGFSIFGTTLAYPKTQTEL